MQRRPTVTIASVFIFVLGGCSSFNNSFNTYELVPLKATAKLVVQTDPEPKEDPDPVISAPPQAITVEVQGNPCTASPWPQADHPPELPTKALLAANGDVYLIERIERKHIDELRAYISERRRVAREARERFAEKCVTVSK